MLIESTNVDRRLIDVLAASKPTWPSHLPGLSVNDLAWSHGTQSGYLNYVLPDPKERAIFFCKCFPETSLSQVLRLFRADQKLKLELFDWPELLEGLFGSVFQSRGTGSRGLGTLDFLAFLSSLSDSFLAWSEERKLTPGDFLSIQSWLNTSKVLIPALQPQILTCVSELKLSKTESLKAIELLLECADLGRDVDHLLNGAAPSPAAWFDELKQLRYPETFGFDDKREKALLSLPLPKGSRVRWTRQGDRGFLEFSTQLARSEDFDKVIEALKKTQTELQVRDPDYWRGR
jgi:hypothetical protein